MEILYHKIRGNPIESRDIDHIFTHCKAIYDHGINALKEHFTHGTDPAVYPTYPFIGCYIPDNILNEDWNISFGIVYEKGYYGTTLTHLDIFEDYIKEQLGNLIKNHNIDFICGESFDPIPLPYAIRHIPDDIVYKDTKQTKFVMPNLTRIHDNVANVISSCCDNFTVRPLSLFEAERIDFSIHRLEHYTGTSIEHFQNFIIFVNYTKYMEAFIQYGIEKLTKEYEELIGPDDKAITSLHEFSTDFQMPALHLKRPDKNGITFVNIGVGPSNAKTITDHLAVLRPHCWLMLGHCAGLRHSQLLGDYVLAHAYVREDHILDDDLPLEIPIPVLAEVQMAVEEAVAHIYGAEPRDIKRCLRTGTVLTTADRNWELKSANIYERFKRTRAIAVDMESATIAANGFRMRVPYGTLLCISDKPIQGEIKLKNMAKDFYKKRIEQHLEIALKTVEILQQKTGLDKLHSRKLRGFDDPPFR